MACFICGNPNAVIACTGDDAAACAEKCASWRPVGLVAALGEAGDSAATFTHVHDPRYLEPDYLDDEDEPFGLSPETVSAAAEYLSLHSFTVEFFPYVTPLSEIPAALGGRLPAGGRSPRPASAK